MAFWYVEEISRPENSGQVYDGKRICFTFPGRPRSISLRGMRNDLRAKTVVLIRSLHGAFFCSRGLVDSSFAVTGI